MSKSLAALVLMFWASLAAGAAAETSSLAKLEPVTVATEMGATMFTAEIADTAELRARGLMFRHKLPPDRAMLFDFGEPRAVSMWMKNTYIPLDMLFIRKDGTIAAIAENTMPLSQDIIGVQEPVLGVLELAAGTARRIGLKRDDKVYHRIFSMADD
jgi:hypothetical protein